MTLERPAGIPTDPGVYRFRDRGGRVIYVGKAINLRSRLNSYFATNLPVRTAAMMTAAHELDWVVVRNEAEALILEYTWIKEFDPRFNVKYRDDKSYPYVAVTLQEEFPRFFVTRENRRRSIRYFGPYAHAWAIRETVDALQWVFPIRSCRDGVYRRAVQTGRPCLLGYIDKCSAPCVGRIDEAQYRALVDKFCGFLSGGSQGVLADLAEEMEAAAKAERFEEAARIRDRIEALRQAMAKNAVALGDGVDVDVIAMVDEPLEMGVQVFFVRDGMVIAERAFVVEKDEDQGPEGYADRVMQHVFADAALDLPREVLINVLPSTHGAWEALLSERRGAQVAVRTPQRGPKADLMGVVLNNAKETLARHQRDRSRDLNTRSAALRELQEVLALPEPPLRIECIDISTLQGKDTVGALVVFEDALPRKKDYRSFIITEGTDDVTAIGEVVRRRFRNAKDESAYRPGLLIVDGGEPQVRGAQVALEEVGASDIPVIGLAKRLEEIWLPTGNPIVLSRRSEALYLLQRVRDEAHRRAINHHRGRRSNRAIGSALDDIQGLGTERARRLLKHFGSVKRLRSATVDQLAEVPGVGTVLAARIHQHLTGAQDE